MSARVDLRPKPQSFRAHTPASVRLCAMVVIGASASGVPIWSLFFWLSDLPDFLESSSPFYRPAYGRCVIAILVLRTFALVWLGRSWARRWDRAEGQAFIAGDLLFSAFDVFLVTLASFFLSPGGGLP